MSLASLILLEQQLPVFFRAVSVVNKVSFYLSFTFKKIKFRRFCSRNCRLCVCFFLLITDTISSGVSLQLIHVLLQDPQALARPNQPSMNVGQKACHFSYSHLIWHCLLQNSSKTTKQKKMKYCMSLFLTHSFMH